MTYCNVIMAYFINEKHCFNELTINTFKLQDFFSHLKNMCKPVKNVSDFTSGDQQGSRQFRPRSYISICLYQLHKGKLLLKQQRITSKMRI